MRRLHATALSTLLGAAAVVGATAALRTVRLGAAASSPRVARVPDAVVAARRRKLDRWAASLAKARAARPPALPAVPHYAPVAIPPPPSAAAAASAPQAPRVVVVRQASAPVHTTTHSSPTGEREDDGEHEGGGDD